MFQKSWDSISNIGLTQDTGNAVTKRIKLTNQLSFISIALTFFYTPVFIYWGLSKVIPFQGVAIFIYISSILLAINSNFLLSRFIYIIGLYLHMFVLCLSFGNSSQMHLIFIPVTAVPLILFDLSQTRIIIGFMLISIFFYSLLYFLDFHSWLEIPISGDKVSMMRLFFNLTAIGGEVVVIGSFISGFEQKEKQLDESNSLMQQQLQAIFENSYDALFLVDWKKRRIIKGNQRAVEMFDMDSEQEFYDRYGTDLHKVAPTEAEMLTMRNALNTKGLYEGEVLYKTKTGREFWGALAIKLVEIGTEKYQSVRITDVSVEKKAKAHMEASLQEKEILLSEIHHRVKNNMAVISGLLGLQSGYVEDAKSRSLFEESRNRIHSMALIHDKLYNHETFARIDFNAYCNDLINYIKSSYNATSANVNFILNCHDVLVDIKNAVPCGLILNELISNAYKHAFHGRGEGTIIITCTKMGGKFTMMVSDNGSGFDAEDILEKPVSLGLTLITALVAQVNGTIKAKKKDGTTYFISFEE